MPSNTLPDHTTVAIIGSGLTGLYLGQRLRLLGINALLADKGRYPGGRMAARNVGLTGMVNTGPRFFMTCKAGDGLLFTPQWLETNTQQGKNSDICEIPEDLTGYMPGFAVHKPAGSFREFSLALASGLEMHQQLKLTTLKQGNDRWILTFESTDTCEIMEMTARHVVLTLPAPRIAETLTNSGLNELIPSNLTTNIKYERSLVGMFEIELTGQSETNETILTNDGTGLRRMLIRSDRSSSSAVAYIESTDDFAEQHREASKEVVLGLFQAMLRRHVAVVDVKSGQFHRWNYARIRPGCKAFPGPLVVSEKPFLMLAGEGFGVADEVPAGLVSAQRSAEMAAQIMSAIEVSN